MKISCDCGAFIAKLKAFPKHTPGRLVCYCDDCQAFVEKIQRADVLDAYGGTEEIPVYPKEIEIIQGIETLKCYRLTTKGTYRWATSCCNSPILNIKPGFPWAGTFYTTYKDPAAPSALGDVKARIYGKYALAGAPFKISEKIAFKDMLVVMPFLVKGIILGMDKQSPFFGSDNKTPIVEPEILG